MHTIRLGGPWIRSVNDESIRVSLPDDSETGDHAVYVRKFHSPTNVDEHRVFVVIEKWNGSLVELQINGHRHEISQPENYRADITEHLIRYNELRVVIEASDECRPQLLGPVAIEIEEAGS